MKKPSYIYKFLFNYLLMFINLFVAEVIFRILSGYSFLEWSFFRIFVELNIISIVFSMFLSLFKLGVSKVINTIITFVFVLYTFLQIGFYNYLGVYISFGASTQAGAVKDYIWDFLSSLSWTYYLEFVLIIITIIVLIIFRKKFKIIDFKHKSSFYLIFVSLIFTIYCLLYVVALKADFMQNPLQQVSNKELFNHPSVPSIAIKEFGTVGYGFLDVKALIIPHQEEVFEEEEKIEKEVEEVTDYSRIIDDRAWEALIENEKNTTKNNLNKYLINKKITPKNDYTGLFEDKNLIVIMMESVNDIIINEEFFPNFYKLYTEGWHFSNNYSPRNSCATGNNEMSAMTGLYSINDSCTANKFKTNTYFEAIFNLFNNKGYKTTSMHDYTESYYKRSVIHPNMGSGKYYGVQKLGIPYYYNYGEWASDEDFFKSALNIFDKYKEDEKFMTYLITVSSHQPYSFSSPFGDKYLSVFKKTKYNIATKRYLSKLKVLDNAIGILVNGLEERGKLEDTVIVLFADHYPYGLAKSNIQSVLGYDISKDSLADKTPLVIYNPTLEPKEFKQYNTYMNLTPTLANLFNLDYDPRLYFGHDALSEEYEGIVVFADGSWKNEHVYYNASNSKVTYYDDYYSIQDIKKISDGVTKDIKMSALAIKNNYFSYLGKGLIKYKVEDPVEVEEPVDAEVPETETPEVEVAEVNNDELQ